MIPIPEKEVNIVRLIYEHIMNKLTAAGIVAVGTSYNNAPLWPWPITNKSIELLYVIEWKIMTIQSHREIRLTQELCFGSDRAIHLVVNVFRNEYHYYDPDFPNNLLGNIL